MTDRPLGRRDDRILCVLAMVVGTVFGLAAGISAFVESGGWGIVPFVLGVLVLAWTWRPRGWARRFPLYALPLTAFLVAPIIVVVGVGPSALLR